MKKVFSRILIATIIIFSLIFTYRMRIWETGVIEWDVISYYAYLPAVFVYHDLNMEYKDSPNFKYKLWTEKAPNGCNVVKMTLGLSILYAPFFMMAHGLALVSSFSPPDGYSSIYSLFLILSNIFYTAVGFIYLRKLLLLYFEDWIVGLVLLITFFSTNLLYYGLYNVMAHTYLFALITIFLYYIVQWNEKTSYKNSLFLGLLFGLIVLIRPVHLVLIVLLFFYGVYDLKSLRGKIKYFITHFKFVFTIGVSSFMVISLQLLYWKVITGDWFYWSYTGEHFFWSKPHIVEGLISFRKGWFTYVPIMLPATLGLFFIKKTAKNWSFTLPFFWIVFTYVIFSWWCWWYGGGFSIRAYIDIYGIMAIGLGSVFSLIAAGIRKRWIKVVLMFTIGVISLYSSFVVLQEHCGVIHFDSMTKESWRSVFLKLEASPEYWNSLKTPNYDKACKTGEE